MSTTSPLTDPSLALVLSFAPAGLGHLRVTDALRHELPPEAQPILFTTEDESLKFLHRLTSTNPFGKRIFSWLQHGAAETTFTRLYRRYLRRHTKKVSEQLHFVLQQRVTLPKTLVVVASHFGIAHQIAAIKPTLEKTAGIRVLLIVQVTDDSPQKIWYVPGADRIFVPSDVTKKALEQYGREAHLPPVEIRVVPYPVSPELTEMLTKKEFEHRQVQFNRQSTVPIQVSIPISGAAVGLMWVQGIMNDLHKLSNRFQFHITLRQQLYTDVFRNQMSNVPYARLYSSPSDREIVELYEQSYQQTIMGLEITKPSEQAFKALLTTEQRGGVILLFAAPVGRQEFDNLQFLRRNHLLPTKEDEQTLWKWGREDLSLSSASATKLLARARHWRCLTLPPSSSEAAQFIYWTLEHGLLAHLFHTKLPLSWEIGSHGAKLLWKEVSRLLQKPE